MWLYMIITSIFIYLCGVIINGYFKINKWYRDGKKPLAIFWLVAMLIEGFIGIILRYYNIILTI